MLQSHNYKLHILSAKALFKLRQYKKVIAICDTIKANEKEDETLLHTADQLHHLALKMLANEMQPHAFYQSETTESYFETNGFVHRLLSGSISIEDLETTQTIEQQLFKEIYNNASLTVLQKADKVFLTILIHE